MSVGFPPQPVYPQAVDSNYTLFLVYNTGEARLAADNAAWAQEIEIYPVGPDEPEIWADNGFGNLEGELFYYDAVEKNEYGKVDKLKRCARNLGGQPTKFNKASTVPTPGCPCKEKGVWVRGMVIAEHHNQIVDCTIATEQFLTVVDSCAQDLIDEPPCPDDVPCPEIDFSFKEVTEPDPCEGTTYQYAIEITGNYSTFELDFGDGQTSTSLTGTHTYPPNTRVDPIVRVASENCTIAQSPTSRTTDRPVAPTVADPPNWLLPIPEVPTFPVPSIPPISCDVDIELPQIVVPGIEIPSFILSGINIEIPSIIQIVPPIPTIITIVPEIPTLIVIEPEIPSIITIEPSVITIEPSVIEIVGDIPTQIEIVEDIPNVITVIDDIPSEISIVGCSSEISLINAPSEISMVNCCSEISLVNWPDNISLVNYPSEISLVCLCSEISLICMCSEISLVNWPSEIGISWGTIPSIEISWGTVPTISCDCTISVEVVCANPTPSFAVYADSVQHSPVVTEVIKKLGLNDTISMQPPQEEAAQKYRENYRQKKENILDLGIPSEISLVAPEIPELKLIHNLPSSISLEVPAIPTIEAKWIGEPLPSEIRFVSDNLIPTTINLLATEIPAAIPIDATAIPTALRLEPASNFPTELKLNAEDMPTEVKVTGFPDSIKVDIPSEIVAKLEVPENLEVPLVYKGGPIPIEFGKQTLMNSSGEGPCFQLVPCNPTQ